jgi:hypothetical protein
MIEDDAVTLAKMAGGTDGNLITYDAAGDPAYVLTGTAAQVLTSNGPGAAPTFETIGIPAEASAANIRAGAAGTYVSGSAMETASGGGHTHRRRHHRGGLVYLPDGCCHACRQPHARRAHERRAWDLAHYPRCAGRYGFTDAGF